MADVASFLFNLICVVPALHFITIAGIQAFSDKTGILHFSPAIADGSKKINRKDALPETHPDISDHGVWNGLSSLSERRTDGGRFKEISTICPATGLQGPGHPSRVGEQFGIAFQQREASNLILQNVGKGLPPSIPCDSIKKKNVLLYCGPQWNSLVYRTCLVRPPSRKARW